jgi:hypothetical protein
MFELVLWVTIGFNANPDTAFFFSADQNPDQGSQTNADPCGSGAWSQIVEFLHEN